MVSTLIEVVSFENTFYRKRKTKRYKKKKREREEMGLLSLYSLLWTPQKLLVEDPPQSFTLSLS